MVNHPENQRDYKYKNQGSANRGEVLKSSGRFCIINDTGSEWVHSYLLLLLFISSVYV